MADASGLGGVFHRVNDPAGTPINLREPEEDCT